MADTELYDVLEVSRHATDSEIRKVGLCCFTDLRSSQRICLLRPSGCTKRHCKHHLLDCVAQITIC